MGEIPAEPKPSPQECAEKTRLISELVEAHKRIAAIHNQEIEAVIAGDLSAKLDGQLKEARGVRDSIMKDLKDHLAKHHC